jgi:hypothetical protein
MIYLFLTNHRQGVLTSSRKITARKRWGDAPGTMASQTPCQAGRALIGPSSSTDPFPDPSDALAHPSMVNGAARALLPPDLSALRALAMCHARRHSRSDLRCGLPVELRWCRRLYKDSLLAGGWDAFGTMLRDS